mgnify:CR=1 FL=1
MDFETLFRIAGTVSTVFTFIGILSLVLAAARIQKIKNNPPHKKMFIAGCVFLALGILLPFLFTPFFNRLLGDMLILAIFSVVYWFLKAIGSILLFYVFAKNFTGPKNNAPDRTAAAQTPRSDADELKKYRELLEQGVITQEEFDKKKNQLLGS